MATTPNFNLDLHELDDLDRELFDWVEKLSGTATTSNMMIIDAILAQLRSDKANRVVESPDEPSGLSVGDEWDRLL